MGDVRRDYGGPEGGRDTTVLAGVPSTLPTTYHSSLTQVICGIAVCAIYAPQTVENAAVDFDAVSRALLGWQFMLFSLLGWPVAIVSLAMQVCGRRLSRCKLRRAHPISAPLSGFTSAFLVVSST